MILKSLVPLPALAVALAGLAASAQDAEDTEGQLVERVVVRNRLYTMDKRLEVAPTVGFTIVTRLTDHNNFNVGIAYNFSNTIAAEIRGGWALSRQTGLARQVGEHLLQRDPAREVEITDDLSNLWEMKFNGLLGARWAPLYGKINLMAELPVHFQTYLWAGAGAGTFERQSLVICRALESRPNGTCANWFTEDRISYIVSGALGFRFFTHQGGAVKLEVRSLLYPDKFKEDVNRLDAEAGIIDNNGHYASNPGFSNLVLFDLGYSFIF